MPTVNFSSNELHKQRTRVIRVGDIVIDTGWFEDSGAEIRIVVQADVRTMERAAWFSEMVFGDRQPAREVA